MARQCEVRGIPVPNLAFEPGRAIVGRAGVTLYEVGTTKPVALDERRDTRLYVSVDGGMSDNARPALYGAQFSARIASRTSDAEPALARVVGKHCESGDIVVDAEYLPGDVSPGDLLAVPATGAYCFSLASNYNYVPRPPVVALRGGEARVIVRGETIDDLLARDAGLDTAFEAGRPLGTHRWKGSHDRLPPPPRRAAGSRSRGLAGRVAAAPARRRARRPGGSTLELVGIAVRDVDAKRDVELPRELFTTDADTLIVGSDIVIELMGGIEPARTYLLHAINSGADVVTANKALLATHGPEIFDAADQVGAEVYYEAAAAGAIPIIRPLRDSLAGDRVQRIMGIVNGTTNYILDRMDTEGAEFSRRARRRAAPRVRRSRSDGRRRGLRRGAEGRDPREPRLPHDGAARVGAPRGHHRDRQVDDGCRAPRRLRHQAARRLRAADRGRSGESISVRVYPALIDRAHPLASVHGANNAVFVQAEAAGNLMFYGAGAGGVQTASAVLGDVVSAARRHIAGGVGVGESTLRQPADRARSAASRRATRSRSRSTTSRACSRRSRASSATVASRSRPSSRPWCRRCERRRRAASRDS